MSQQAREQIVLSWPHIRNMLWDRGYAVDGAEPNVSSSLPIAMTFEPIPPVSMAQRVRPGRRTGELPPVPAPGQSIIVLLTGETTVGVKTVRTLATNMRTAGVRSAIVFSEEGATSFTGKELETYGPEAKIEVMLYKHFFYTCVDHRLIPEHDVLTGKEKLEVLNKWGVEEWSLPKQDVSDVVSRYYGLAVGDAVRYYRKFGTTEVIPYVRVVHRCAE